MSDSMAVSSSEGMAAEMGSDWGGRSRHLFIMRNDAIEFSRTISGLT